MQIELNVLPDKRRLWPVVIALTLAACSGIAPQPPTPAPAPAAPPLPAVAPAPVLDEKSVVPAVVLPAATRHALIAALAYRQGLHAMSANELTRERNQLASQLASQPGNPENQMRLALLYAQTYAQAHPQTRTPTGDPAKALALADALLKSTAPAAVALHPLAALLVEQLAERVRLEGQNERQQVQGKEQQRKIHDLQEKLERLANIERSLPARAPQSPPTGKQP